MSTTSRPKVLIIQPGAFGDIIICAPIAKWYFDKGYEVIWPVQEKYFSHLESIVSKYATPILIEKECTGQGDWLKEASDFAREFAEPGMEILELSDRNGPLKQKSGENFEQFKYRLADVPFKVKHHLEFKLEPERWKSLARDVGAYGDYSLVHLESSDGEVANIPGDVRYRTVQVQECENYNIVDWYGIVRDAKEIFCVESSFHCFVDGIISELKVKPVIIPRHGHPKYTISEGWDLRLYESN